MSGNKSWHTNSIFTPTGNAILAGLRATPSESPSPLNSNRINFWEIFHFHAYIRYNMQAYGMAADPRTPMIYIKGIGKLSIIHTHAAYGAHTHTHTPNDITFIFANSHLAHIRYAPPGSCPAMSHQKKKKANGRPTQRNKNKCNGRKRWHLRRSAGERCHGVCVHAVAFGLVGVFVNDCCCSLATAVANPFAIHGTDTRARTHGRS